MLKASGLPGSGPAAQGYLIGVLLTSREDRRFSPSLIWRISEGQSMDVARGWDHVVRLAREGETIGAGQVKVSLADA